MASRRLQRQYAYVLSVLGHAAIVVALTFSIPLSSRQSPDSGGVVVPIETVMINESLVEAEMARLEAEEEAERLRQQQEAEQLREQREAEQRELERIQREREVAEQERIEREQQAEQERIRLARLEEERLEAERREAERLERERQEELERQREEAARLAAEKAAEEERLRREAEEAARRRAVEAEIERAMEAERRAREAENSGLRAQWAAAISDKVQLYWNQPPNAGVGLECVLVVTQLPNGEVTDVMVESCNRDDLNIIRSVENAVLNASPLPGPPRGVPFERVVRITFRPIQ